MQPWPELDVSRFCASHQTSIAHHLAAVKANIDHGTAQFIDAFYLDNKGKPVLNRMSETVMYARVYLETEACQANENDGDHLMQVVQRWAIKADEYAYDQFRNQNPEGPELATARVTLEGLIASGNPSPAAQINAVRDYINALNPSVLPYIDTLTRTIIDFLSREHSRAIVGKESSYPKLVTQLVWRWYFDPAASFEDEESHLRCAMDYVACCLREDYPLTESDLEFVIEWTRQCIIAEILYRSHNFLWDFEGNNVKPLSYIVEEVGSQTLMVEFDPAGIDEVVLYGFAVEHYRDGIFD